MLSPVSLRICWVAAMAPALTEAATQANSFTLPNSPATESFSHLHNKEPKLCDISQSFATLSQIGARSDVYAKKNADCNDLALLPWTDHIKLNLKNHEQLNNYKLFNGHTGTRSQTDNPCRQASVTSLHGLKDQCPKPSSKQTMNENPPHIQDTMGLLNANTSLDCELKGKLADGSQPMDSEEKLFLVTPGDTLIPTCNVNSKRPPVLDLEQRVTTSKNEEKDCSVKVDFCVNKKSSVVDAVSSLATRNVQLRQRAVQLFSRFRRMQVQQVEGHVKGQLKAFVEHQQQNLGIPCQQKMQTTNNFRIQNSEDLLHSEDVKNLSTSALVSLVRKFESSQQVKNFSQADFDKKMDVSISPADCLSIKQTISKLRNSLSYLERELDSDATDSSSSDESGLEEECSRLRSDSYLPSSRKRVTWRWAVDRAAVASRWIWLQTQVSDLEYKIRQQTDVYKHLRSHKGPLTFADQSHGRPLVNVEDRVTSGEGSNKNSLSSCFGTKAVNGFRPSETMGNGYNSSDKGDDGRSDVECVRTRPLRMFRKRKLVRTMGLHLTNRKVTRLSTVRCTCNSQRDLLPCIICSGRYNSVQTLDPDTMTLAERISLLDSSYHSVLSFKNDACLGIRYEKILRRCEFSKSAEKQGLMFKKRRFAISLADQARKHTRKLTKNAAQTLLSSAKMRKTLGSRHHRFSRLKHKGKRRLYAGRPDSSFVSERLRTCSVSSNGSSKPTSPAPSPVPSLTGDAVEVQEQGSYRVHSSNTLHELLRRRRFENAFDINNIVIPHSVAASTRVEKLQYKEILTPKWRVLGDIENHVTEEPEVDEVEDLSDDIYVIRHLKCEEDEKKKFLSYVTNSGHGRSRLRSSRLENRADSSGANTPDPMSPYPADSSSNQEAPCGWNSPVASPPPTPNSFIEEHGTSPAMIGRERRRTLSLSKRLSEDDHQFLLEEYFSVPYEPRVFPLAEEAYFEMLKDSPHLQDVIQCEAVNMANEDAGLSVSRPHSPGNSSSVGSAPEEDPNDPEWTVMTGNRIRKPSIILKLAKR